MELRDVIEPMIQIAWIIKESACAIKSRLNTLNKELNTLGK